MFIAFNDLLISRFCLPAKIILILFFLLVLFTISNNSKIHFDSLSAP